MRGKEAIKLLKKAIKQDHLYSEEELKYMRQQLKIVEQHYKDLELQTSKGFGKK
jgi:hypothetical protein